MLLNAYFLAKFRFDTAENEHAKNLQILQNLKTHRAGRYGLNHGPVWRHFSTAVAPLLTWFSERRRRASSSAAAQPARASRIWTSYVKYIFEKCIFRKFCKFLAGSFSAVSKRNFARKYAFDSIFQALQDVHTFAPLQIQHLNLAKNWLTNDENQ